MRAVTVLAIVVPVAVTVAGCAGARRDTRAAPRASPTAATSGVAEGDERGAKDVDGRGQQDEDDYLVLAYGHAADAADERAVAALVRRYMAAAAARDGAAACRLVYARVNKGSKLLEAIPLPYTPGPESPLKGKTCPVVVSWLFREDRARLRSEIGSLRVTGLRVSGRHGLALLGFTPARERYIAVIREGRVWKVEGLLDSQLP
jgi:hypothetical protein